MILETDRPQAPANHVSANIGPVADWKNAVQEARKSTRKYAHRQSQQCLGDEKADKENFCPAEKSYSTKDDCSRELFSDARSDEISDSYVRWERRLADWEARLVERDFALTQREEKVDEHSRTNEEKVLDLEVVEMRLAARAKQLADSEAACSSREMSLAKREEALKNAERQKRAEVEAACSAREAELAKREEAAKMAEQQRCSKTQAAIAAREKELNAREERLKQAEANDTQLAVRAKQLAEKEFLCKAWEDTLRRRDHTHKYAEQHLRDVRIGASSTSAAVEQGEPTWWSVVDDEGGCNKSPDASDMELSDDDKSQARISRVPSRGCLDDFLRLAEGRDPDQGKIKSSTRIPAKSSGSCTESQKHVRFGREDFAEKSLPRSAKEVVDVPAKSLSGAMTRNADRNADLQPKTLNLAAASSQGSVSRSLESRDAHLAPRSLLTTFDGHDHGLASKTIPSGVLGSSRDVRDPDCMSVASSTAGHRRRAMTARKTIASRQTSCQVSRQTSCCPSPDRNDHGLCSGLAESSLRAHPNPRSVASAPILTQNEQPAASGFGARLSTLASKLRTSMSGATAPSAV